MRHGDRGWLIVAAVVVAIEATAEDGELLSEAADRKPWVSRAIGALIFGHVANLIPPRFDPIHIMFTAARRRLYSRRVL